MMKLRPYLTFDGECKDAIALYERAFHAKVMQIVHFSDMPSQPDFTIPNKYMDRILQCTLQFGDEFIRLSDCGPNPRFNGAETQRISIAVEAGVEEVRHAFGVLAAEGRIGMPLGETHYSPCAGVVFDRYGVMWNFVGQK